MDESDPEEKTFPPAEDSGDVSSSERQQQSFSWLRSSAAFLEHAVLWWIGGPRGCSDPSV